VYPVSGFLSSYPGSSPSSLLPQPFTTKAYAAPAAAPVTTPAMAISSALSGFPTVLYAVQVLFGLYGGSRCQLTSQGSI